MSALHHLPEALSALVTIERNPLGAGYTARCNQRGESVTAHRYTWAAAWAENHTCDTELLQLLELLDRRAA